MAIIPVDVIAVGVSPLRGCMPEIGQTISHYQIIEMPGQGGMGEALLWFGNY